MYGESNCTIRFGIEWSRKVEFKVAEILKPERSLLKPYFIVKR